MLVKTLLEGKPRKLITARTATTVDDAMDLLISHNIGCLPVVDDSGTLIALVSDKDIFRKCYQTKGNYHSLTVADIMTVDVIVGVMEDEISYIAGVMDKNWIRHVPIVDGEKLIGLVSQRDIIKMQAEHAEIENRYLRMYIDGMGTSDRSSE